MLSHCPAGEQSSPSALGVCMGWGSYALLTGSSTPRLVKGECNSSLLSSLSF